jgi:hypothetical protein
MVLWEEFSNVVFLGGRCAVLDRLEFRLRGSPTSFFCTNTTLEIQACEIE